MDPIASVALGISVIALQIAIVCAFVYVGAFILSRVLDERLLPVVGQAVLALLGMLFFWVGLASAHLLGWLRIACFAAVAALTVLGLVKRFWPKDLIVPLAIVFFGSIVLQIWAFWPSGIHNMLGAAGNRWIKSLPNDNMIPYDFAQAILQGHIPSPLVGDWLSSDRPPLQTGIFLLTAISTNSDIAYEVVSVTLQLLAVSAVYFLVRSLGRSTSAAVWTALAALFTPIAIINGIYVWPKLIASAFLLFAMAIYFAGKKDWSLPRAILIGTCSAAAMLCHGGSAFALIGFVLAALVMRRWPLKWSFLLGVVVTGILLYGPWLAYQKFYDPPGDRLLKWHLAGAIAPDSRTVVEAVRDAYTGMSASEFLLRQESKAANLVRGAEMPFAGPVLALTGQRGGVLQATFYYPIASIGLFGGVVLLLPFVAFADRTTRPTLVAIAGTVIVWGLFMYDPAGIVVHQGAFLPELGVVALVGYLIGRWHWALMLMTVAQLAWTLVVFNFPMAV